MKIAVFSDSHDHLDKMRAALNQVKERGITTGLHLGDFCAPPAVECLAESDIHWYCVWGNVDGDRHLSADRVKDKPNMDLATAEFRELELEGRTIFLTHYPKIAEIAATSGMYNAVFHGHDHKMRNEMIGETLLANPGELGGFRFGTASFGIYDTETNTLEHVTL